ncbi:hypothetical protein MUK42_24204 [Musa troglodytarum]|uniref:Uncharacterized protein n=1 Tax=Musa troglodytarum TaxID=320322 RepID=A0A9E7JM52_9LILI|nr:hypothetical protein MUK42_24204 [Musa troglodytarum]
MEQRAETAAGAAEGQRNTGARTRFLGATRREKAIRLRSYCRGDCTFRSRFVSRLGGLWILLLLRPSKLRTTLATDCLTERLLSDWCRMGNNCLPSRSHVTGFAHCQCHAMMLEHGCPEISAQN